MFETVRFDKTFYVREGLDAAVEAYASMAETVLEEDEQGFNVRITARDPERAELIMDHFCNHALFISIESRGEVV